MPRPLAPPFRKLAFPKSCDSSPSRSSPLRKYFPLTKQWRPFSSIPGPGRIAQPPALTAGRSRFAAFARVAVSDFANSISLKDVSSSNYWRKRRVLIDKVYDGAGSGGGEVLFPGPLS